MSQDIQTLALFRLSALGDVLMYLPTVRALQAAFPQAKLSWIISQPAYDLVKDISGIEFIVINKPKRLMDYWQLYQKFSSYHFDVLLATQASLRTNLIYPLIRAKRKIGYDRVRSRDGHQWFIDEAIPFRKTHTLESFLQFAEHLGADTSAVTWNLPIDSSSKSWADDYLEHQRNAPGPWIALNPAASKRERTWNLQGYIELIQALKTRYHANILLIGGPGSLDLEIAQAINARVEVNNLVAKTKLSQLLALIAGVDLLICPDTGPSHMAAALNKPVVALHAVTRPEVSGPYGQLHHVVNRYEDAVKRFGLTKNLDEDARWFQKVHHPEVMQLISLEDVLTQVEKILNY